MTGIRWSALNQFVLQAIGLILSIVLARFLGPEIFGTIAMITVITGFLEIVSRSGLSNSLIQKEEVIDIEYQTIFWVNVLLGFTTAGVLFLFAFVLEDFYGHHGLKSVAWVLSLNFIIQSFPAIHLTMLRKELDFKKLFFIDASSIILSGAIAIYLAITGFGIWSIVIRSLLASVMTTIVVYRVTSWRPKFAFQKQYLNQHLSFALPLLGSASFRYWTQNIDNLLIGRFLGNVELGLYSRSYSVLMLPVTNISGVIAGVMFPSMAMIKDDLERLKNVYLRMNRAVLYLLAPLMLIIYLEARSFVIILLGEMWLKSIPLIELFALISPIVALNSVNGSLIIALGKTRLQFRLVAFTGSISIGAILLGLRYGLLEVVVFYGFSTMVTMFILWYFSAFVLGISVGRIFREVSKIIALIVCTILSVFALKYFVQIGDELFGILFTGVTVFLFYFFYSIVLGIAEFQLIINQFRGMLNSVLRWI